MNSLISLFALHCTSHNRVTALRHIETIILHTTYIVHYVPELMCNEMHLIFPFLEHILKFFLVQVVGNIRPFYLGKEIFKF